MPKVVSNDQHLAIFHNTRNSSIPKSAAGNARSLRTSRFRSTIDNRHSRIPPAPFSNSAAYAECHHVTLLEKNVLAKRSHLTPTL